MAGIVGINLTPVAGVENSSGRREDKWLFEVFHWVRSLKLRSHNLKSYWVRKKFYYKDNWGKRIFYETVM